MNSKMRDGARNALSMGASPSMTEVDNAIFSEPGGSLSQLDEGRIVAKATPINLIWADVKQPRRAIPISIRMHWDGNPASVPDLLRQMHQVAEEAAGQPIDVVALLNGEGEGLDSDKFPSVAKEYISLVRLAAHINAHGLENPITIIESDGRLVIEAGERRWLSFHLLNIYLGDKWAKVPSIKADGKDSLWRQAGENTLRSQLNAISLARQIALLVMDAREKDGDNNYLAYEDIVKAGGSDRRFYAQIADGTAHRIPRGMGERIQTAMHLGMEQISQYRRLLRLTDDEQVNDALWTRADVESWPERALRDISTLTTVKVREVIERPNWTLDDLRALKDVPVSRPPMSMGGQPQQPPIPRLPVTSEWMHKGVRTKGDQLGQVIAVDGDWIRVRLEDGNRTQKLFQYTDLTIIASDVGGRTPVVPAPQPQRSTSVPGFEHDFRIGDNVRTRTGHEGVVVGLSGRLVSVKTKNGTNSHDHTLLTKIAAESKFVIGDHVRTTNGRTGGTVQGFNGDTVLVKFPGGEPFSVRENLLLLEDYTPEVHEDDIEEDVDPDVPQQPEREWREGISIGGNNQLGSDKADSESQPAEPKMIIAQDNTHWYFVQQLINAAEVIEDHDTESVFQRLMLFTDVDAKQMHQDGQLKPRLDKDYDQIKAAVEEWLQVQIPAILQKIMDAAVS